MSLQSFGDDEGNKITGLAPTADYEKLAQLIGQDDEAMQRTGYTLATTLQQDELVFPQEGEPYEALPYEGDDYLDDLKAEKLKFAKARIERYLPGFVNLPKDMIDVVVEFVFLSEGPTLHIQLEEDMIEHELGEDFYHRGAHFQEIQKPENAEIVAMMNDMRENPKAHDVKFYYIYSANASYNGSDPFARIDPHGMGGSQSGYFDGFSEEYKKVTTDQKYVIDSFLLDQAFIQMMRDLRPDHEEEVIN